MAKIFLSYSSEDYGVASELYYALKNINHDVFFDAQNIRIGEEYNLNISNEIKASDFAILLLSADFFSENSYCKTELMFMQENWPAPVGRIFPAIVRDFSFEIIPEYIKSVSILRNRGNLIAEIVVAIEDYLKGFKKGESIANRVHRLDIEAQISKLDFDWQRDKKSYYVTKTFPYNNDFDKIIPSVKFANKILAFFILIPILHMLLSFIFFNLTPFDPFIVFIVFIVNFPYLLISFFIGLFYYNKVKSRAEMFKEAEERYFLDRKSLEKKISGKPEKDNYLDVLKMYK